MPLEFSKVTYTDPLVDLPTAKSHLRITDTDHDADVALKSKHATDIVADYLKTGADPAWTPTTVPLPVQAAVLYMLTHLYERRGDDMGNEAAGIGDKSVWESVDRMLARFRDPAVK